jgi:glucosamine--fructose-6-phosphate aminotransferase (isomerizing)
MCGIIGILGQAPAAPLLLDALQRLEYRGYDSAGIATLVNGAIERRRAEGKLVNLRELLEREPLAGTVGIGHTRWATHGRPTETNAHPHTDNRVAVVHNGIIENFQALRRELEAAGHAFHTETDTEVVVHLVSGYLDQQMTPQDAVAAALARLEGAFALAIVFAGRHDLMIGARRGSPLAVGYGKGEMYLGSDALALASLTDRICYLEEGDWVELEETGARVHDSSGAVVEREIKQTALSGALIGKGQYRHFMEKEIFEQPAVIGDTLHALLNPLTRQVTLPPPAGGARHRFRVPLPRSAPAGRRRQPVHLPVGRDHRYPRRPALRPLPGPADPVHRQRARKHRRPGVRPGPADSGGPGDRGRLHQGVYHPAHGFGLPGDRRRPSPGHHRPGPGSRPLHRAHRSAGEGRRGAEPR